MAYFLETLTSIGEFSRSIGREAHVFLYNMRPRDHSFVLPDLAGRYPGLAVDVIPLEPLALDTVYMNSKEKTQQALDARLWLGDFASKCPAGKWFLLMEDDFSICDSMAPLMPKLMSYLLQRAPDLKFKGLRVAPGFNGMFLRCSEPRDMARLAETVRTSPIDEMIASAWKAQDTVIVTLANSQMTHLGHVSTVGNHAHTYGASGVPSCGMTNTAHHSIPHHEWFDPVGCCNKLFSPCSGAFSLGPEFLVKHEPGAALGAGLQPTASQQGQSCEVACQSAGLVCDPAFAEDVNQCDTMRKVVGCPTSCFHGVPGYEQPALDVGMGHCLLQQCPSFMFKCDSSHFKTRRVCPCVKKHS